jgi:hypothetical protein
MKGVRVLETLFLQIGFDVLLKKRKKNKEKRMNLLTLVLLFFIMGRLLKYMSNSLELTVRW